MRSLSADCAWCGLPWQGKSTMSYLLSWVWLPHSVDSLGDPPFALAPPEVAPWYRWMRPVPLGEVNSLSAMPILRNTHSSESRLPVEMAVSGMSPSTLLRGRRVSEGAMAVVTHEGTLAMVIL